MELKQKEYDPGQQWFPLGHRKRVRMPSPITAKPTPISPQEPLQKTSYKVGEYIPLLRKSPGSSATATYVTGIKNTSPIVQLYDHGLNRPFSPIQLNTSLNNKTPDNNIVKPIPVAASSINTNIVKPTPVAASAPPKDKYGRPTTYKSYKKSLANDVEEHDTNWGFYDKDFHGGKKRRTRKAARKTKRRRHAKHAASRRQHKRKDRSIKCKN